VIPSEPETSCLHTLTAFRLRRCRGLPSKQRDQESETPIARTGRSGRAQANANAGAHVPVPG